MHQRFIRPRRPGVARLFALAGVLALLLAGPTGAFAIFQRLDERPSPAAGHAEVIAQGVAVLPGGQAAWRVVEDTAEPLDAALPEERALGFAYAESAGILVNDYSYGTQSRLAPGEASFVAPGVTQQRASLSGNDEGYLRIGLVPAGEATDDGGDTLAYAGDPAATPDGARDIDLLRDVLTDGETTDIAAGDFPTLLYVVEGQVRVDDGDRVTRLSTGDGITIDGALSVEATQDAVIIAGVVGAEVPPMPRFSGSVTLDIRTCPADVTKEQLLANAEQGSDEGFTSCEKVDDPVKAGMKINLNQPEGNPLRLADAEQTRDGNVAWSGLAFGDYVLGKVTAYPEGYGDYVVTDGNLGIVKRGNITLDRGNPDAYRVIYLLQTPKAPEGSITVSYYVCSVETFDQFDPANCGTFAGGINTGITGQGIPTQTLADAGEVDESTYRWSNLPIASGETVAEGETGSYLLSFEVKDTEPTPRVVVDGAQFSQTNDGYVVSLTPGAASAEVSYYLVNVLPTRQGNIYVAASICPYAGAPDAECDVPGSVLLPGVTFTTSGGGVLTEATATQAGNAYVWTDATLDMSYTITPDAIVAPDGYSVARIVNYDTGEVATPGQEITVSLSKDAPLANLIVYLDPTG